MKARGRRPSAFIVFECLETPMKHEARVFEMASQSAPNCKQKKTKENKKNKRKQKSHKHVIFAFFCLINAQFVIIMSVFSQLKLFFISRSHNLHSVASC